MKKLLAGAFILACASSAAAQNVRYTGDSLSPPASKAIDTIMSLPEVKNIGIFI